MAKSKDLFQTLKKDHQETKAIFKKLTSSKQASEREQLLEKLREAIVPHMLGEEKAVYPVLLEGEGEERDHALEAIEEHHAAKLVLEELENTEADDERFKAKAKVLMEMVNHHIEEEESAVFDALKESQDEDELNEILEEFTEAKEEALQTV